MAIATGEEGRLAMPDYEPGDVYNEPFIVINDGPLVDFDDPNAVVAKAVRSTGGGAFVVDPTVTAFADRTDVGLYAVRFTIPATYLFGDLVYGYCYGSVATIANVPYRCPTVKLAFQPPITYGLIAGSPTPTRTAIQLNAPLGVLSTDPNEYKGSRAFLKRAPTGGKVGSAGIQSWSPNGDGTSGLLRLTGSGFPTVPSVGQTVLIGG
jgi:hypothetical protein